MIAGARQEPQVDDEVVVAAATRFAAAVVGRIEAIDRHIRIRVPSTGHEVTVARDRLYFEPLGRTWRVG